MDDISREPLPDSDERLGPGGAEQRAGHARGPAELLAHERAELAEDLVVAERELPDVDVGEDAMLSSRADADAGDGDPDADSERALHGLADDAGEPTATGDDETGDDGTGDGERGSDEPGRDDPDRDESPIDPKTLARAIADEASTAELEEELPAEDEGLPEVPELADAAAVADVVFVLMLTSREGLTVFRLAQACNTTQKLVEAALELLRERIVEQGMPIELARNGDTVKWLAKDTTFPYLQRLRGVKKLEKLSPAALETLAVVAYRQPVMRSEIEAIRGVKAGPMLRSLLQHKLVQVTGRADVPGRPLQYGTTKHFLERFGLASLQELPSIKEWKNLG